MLPNTIGVESLVRFTFSIEYQKGQDNAAADALSWVTLKLDAGTVKSILDGVTEGFTERADTHNLVVAEADEEIRKQVGETVIVARAAQVHVNLHVTDWWLPNRRIQYLRLGSNGSLTGKCRDIRQEWKKLMLYQGALYHCHTPTGKLEEVLQFIVPMAHWVADTSFFLYNYNSSTKGQVLNIWFGLKIKFVVVSTSSVVPSQVRWFFLLRNVFCTINHDEMKGVHIVGYRFISFGLLLVSWYNIL